MVQQCNTRPAWDPLPTPPLTNFPHELPNLLPTSLTSCPISIYSRLHGTFSGVSEGFASPAVRRHGRDDRGIGSCVSGPPSAATITTRCVTKPAASSAPPTPAAVAASAAPARPRLAPPGGLRPRPGRPRPAMARRGHAGGQLRPAHARARRGDRRPARPRLAPPGDNRAPACPPVAELQLLPGRACSPVPTSGRRGRRRARPCVPDAAGVEGAAATHRRPPSTSSSASSDDLHRLLRPPLLHRPAIPPPSHASAGRPAPPPLPDLQRGRPAPPPLADLQRFSHRGQPAPSPLADLQHLNHHGKQQLITSRWRLDPTGWSAHTRRPAAPPERVGAWPAREKARSMAWQSWSGARADGILFSLWWLIPDQLRWPYNLFSNFR
nr:formin-like protein 5 [Lolium perenne]